MSFGIASVRQALLAAHWAFVENTSDETLCLLDVDPTFYVAWNFVSLANVVQIALSYKVSETEGPHADFLSLVAQVSALRDRKRGCPWWASKTGTTDKGFTLALFLQLRFGGEWFERNDITSFLTPAIKRDSALGQSILGLSAVYPELLYSEIILME